MIALFSVAPPREKAAIFESRSAHLSVISLPGASLCFCETTFRLRKSSPNSHLLSESRRADNEAELGFKADALLQPRVHPFS